MRTQESMLVAMMFAFVEAAVMLEVAGILAFR